jgi:hypothetical protein
MSVKMKLKENKKASFEVIFITIAAAAIIALAVYALTNPIKQMSSSSSSGGGGTYTPPPATNITYQNIEQEWSGMGLVQDLPKDAEILLRFYNFNTGERQWEKSYVITKGELKEGWTDSPDITVVISSKYLNGGGFTDQNFCSVVKKAQADGNLGFETHISDLAILWKYSGMKKYLSCLGM